MDLNALVTVDMLQRHGWKVIQEAHGLSFKLQKDNLLCWFIPHNYDMVIYDTNITEDCKVVYRGKLATQEQLIMIVALIQN